MKRNLIALSVGMLFASTILGMCGSCVGDPDTDARRVSRISVMSRSGVVSPVSDATSATCQQSVISVQTDQGTHGGYECWLVDGRNMIFRRVDHDQDINRPFYSERPQHIYFVVKALPGAGIIKVGDRFSQDEVGVMLVQNRKNSCFCSKADQLVCHVQRLGLSCFEKDVQAEQEIKARSAENVTKVEYFDEKMIVGLYCLEQNSLALKS